MTTCCVPNCLEVSLPLYTLPRTKGVLSIWIQRIGNPIIAAIPIEQTNRLKSYKVCARHFEEICKSGSKLKRFALPTLHLPAYISDGAEANCFSYSAPEVQVVTRQALPLVVNIEEALSKPQEPSKFTIESPEVEVNVPEKIYGKQKSVESSEANVGLQTIASSHESLPFAMLQFDELQAGPSTSREYSQTGISLDEKVKELAASIGIAVLPSTATSTPSASKGSSKKATTGITEINSPSFRQTPKYASHKRILRKVGATRQGDLTPKAKYFYKQIHSMQRQVRKHKSCRKRLEYVVAHPSITNFVESVNKTTARFIMSQVETQRLKPRGRRFTLDDKIFALTIYKQSPKAYRRMSKIFSFPSRKVLMRVLRNIPFDCGINANIFQHLQEKVSNLTDIQKYCALIFDEIALSPGLQDNKSLNRIDGFVDFGGADRRLQFADHALLFMLRGVFVKWKQPICYVFSEGTTSSIDLVHLIKKLIRKVRTTGLNLVCSICDQGATNQAAINYLLRETNAFCLQNNIENRYQGYLIDNQEIIHLYDFPHLMKGIRNNLLKYNLRYTMGGLEREASWNHIVEMYQKDKARGDFYCSLNRLTDEHVIINKIKKMRVRHCTQVFSHTVGSTMRNLASTSLHLPTDDEYYINPESINTAEILLFFDKLFDSVNGRGLVKPGSESLPRGKHLRCAVTQNSQHVAHWQYCIPILRSMYYIDVSKPQKKLFPPTLKNWIFSLTSLMYLWQQLRQKPNISFLSPRNLNQDPVENYFSSIRSHGVRNTNPTCSSFASSNKALLINNFVSPHAVGANCEPDNCEKALLTLKYFIQNPIPVEATPQVTAPILPRCPNFTESSPILKNYATAYVAGYVLSKTLKACKITTCTECTAYLCAERPDPMITAREYEDSNLQHPSEQCKLLFKGSVALILNYLPKIITFYNPRKLCNDFVISKMLQQMQMMFCQLHQNCAEQFIQITVKTTYYTYINNINKIINGKDLRYGRQDHITSLALQKYRKHAGCKASPLERLRE